MRGVDLSAAPALGMQMGQALANLPLQTQQAQLGALKIGQEKQAMEKSAMMNSILSQAGGDLDAAIDLAYEQAPQLVMELKKLNLEQKFKQAEFRKEEAATLKLGAETEKAKAEAEKAKAETGMKEPKFEEFTTERQGQTWIVKGQYDPKFAGKTDPELLKRGVNAPGYKYSSEGPHALSKESEAAIADRSKLAQTYIEKGNVARRAIPQNQLIQEKLKTVKTGAYSEGLQVANEYLTPLGLGLPASLVNNIEDFNTFQSVSAQMLGPLVKEFGTNPSTKDLEIAIKGNTNARNATGTNMTIARLAGERYWRDDMVGKMFEQDTASSYKNSLPYKSKLDSIPFMGKNSRGNVAFFNEFYDAAKRTGLKDSKGNPLEFTIDNVAKRWEELYGRL